MWLRIRWHAELSRARAPVAPVFSLRNMSAVRIAPPEPLASPTRTRVDPSSMESVSVGENAYGRDSPTSTNALKVAAQAACFTRNLSYEHEEEIELEGCSPSVLKVRLRSSGQHTLFWKKEIVEVADELMQEKHGPVDRREMWRKAAAMARAHRTLGENDVAKLDETALHNVAKQEELTLPAGSCNLYTYPLIKTASEPNGCYPTAAGLRTLKKIIFALYAQTNLLDCEDQVRTSLRQLDELRIAFPHPTHWPRALRKSCLPSAGGRPACACPRGMQRA